MTELVAQWYALLNTLNSVLNEPVRTFAESAGLPPLTALLLGFLGALSPCQISTSLGAFALIGRRIEGGRPFVSGLAYVGGKAVVYLLLGLAFVLAGQALAQSSIPVIVAVRKALGPLMLLVGLALLGVLRLRFSLGATDRLAALAAERLDATRPAGAFALGMAFALAFCPTLFWLFFGLLVPLALVSPGGATFPALFALGTALPLLLGLGGLAVGLRQRGLPGLLSRLQPALTQLAGFVLLLTGLNDTIVYWFL